MLRVEFIDTNTLEELVSIEYPNGRKMDSRTFQLICYEARTELEYQATWSVYNGECWDKQISARIFTSERVYPDYSISFTQYPGGDVTIMLHGIREGFDRVLRRYKAR